MSCQWVKNVGCPAIDGVPGMVALPSGPWQLLHGSAVRRPASRSAANVGVPAVAAKTATAEAPANAKSRLSAGR
ncbi:MAG: hypothetical protein DME05_03210 [Candidatus Rokuibacteriota bacterium]|nr:MAG: hypothetical protein DME05_03210 [Candidatus Rokubacteria bacterium]